MCESDSDVSRDPDFSLVCRLKAWVPAFAGMTEKENEFSALIIAKMAIKICESDSGVRRDDGIRNEFSMVAAIVGDTPGTHRDFLLGFISQRRKVAKIHKLGK